MFRPGDPLTPSGQVFDEPWQAQVLAIADTLVSGGHIAAAEWAETLGDELRRASRTGRPDTPETYYHAALSALERLSAPLGLTEALCAERRETWKRAYLNTPHGQPVRLQAGGK